MSPVQTVAPGAGIAFDGTLFVGPKLQEVIPDVAPGLEYTVNYGIFTVFSKPLYWLLSKIHAFVGNWGWAIVLLTVLIAAAAVIPLKSAVPLVATLFFFGAIVAATHDIAIDGYYMEALDEDGQARYVGYRVMAYRIAMMTGTGVIVTVGARWGWTAAFWAAAAVFGLVFVYHLFFLPEPEEPGRPFGVLLRRLARIRTLLLITGLGWVDATRASVRSMWGLPDKDGSLVARKLIDLLVLGGLGVLVGVSLVASTWVSGPMCCRNSIR